MLKTEGYCPSTVGVPEFVSHDLLGLICQSWKPLGLLGVFMFTAAWLLNVQGHGLWMNGFAYTGNNERKPWHLSSNLGFSFNLTMTNSLSERFQHPNPSPTSELILWLSGAQGLGLCPMSSKIWINVIPRTGWAECWEQQLLEDEPCGQNVDSVKAKAWHHRFCKRHSKM